METSTFSFNKLIQLAIKKSMAMSTWAHDVNSTFHHFFVGSEALRCPTYSFLQLLPSLEIRYTYLELQTASIQCLSSRLSQLDDSKS